MNKLARFTVLLAAAAAISLFFPDSSAFAAGPTDFTVQSADGGSAFTLASARGNFVALHFNPTAASVADHSTQAPTLAGVRHVFVAPSAEKAAALKTTKAPIHTDEGGKLAGQFGVAANVPTTILIGADGTEVWRYGGKSESDALPFRSLAAQVEHRTRATAIDQYNLKAEVALQGYDPVSYFKGAKPAKGVPTIAATWRGVTYHFANAENRAAFAAEPQKYAPTYGGWCATAMAAGEKVEVDPENFKITGGRLFLFYNGVWGNAIKDWNKDEPGLTRKADDSWKKIAGE